MVAFAHVLAAVGAGREGFVQEQAFDSVAHDFEPEISEGGKPDQMEQPAYHAATLSGVLRSGQRSGDAEPRNMAGRRTELARVVAPDYLDRAGASARCRFGTARLREWRKRRFVLAQCRVMHR